MTKYADSLEEQIIQLLSPLNITSDALEKANYVSMRICELAGKPLEVGFYLLDDSLVDREPDVIIKDVYIGHEQTVQHLHCDITPIGKIRSFREIKSMGKRIVGWGHSHADIGTFYSGEDDNTILNSVKKWGINKELELMVSLLRKPDYNVQYSQNGNWRGLEVTVKGETVFIPSTIFLDHTDEYNKKQNFGMFKHGLFEVPFFYGMTFNAQNNEPHCVIAYINEDIPYKLERGITYNIVEPCKRQTVDKQLIDKQLVSRVIELRERYSDFEDKLQNNLETIKKEHTTAVNAITSLSTGHKASAGEEENNLTDLYTSLKRVSAINNKYDFKKEGVFFPEYIDADGYNRKMNNYMDELMNRLSASKNALQKRLDVLLTECKEAPCYRWDIKLRINRMQKMYSYVIDVVERHGALPVGVKNG